MVRAAVVGRFFLVLSELHMLCGIVFVSIGFESNYFGEVALRLRRASLMGKV